jgi:hypothetical protein
VITSGPDHVSIVAVTQVDTGEDSNTNLIGVYTHIPLDQYLTQFELPDWVTDKSDTLMYIWALPDNSRFLAFYQRPNGNYRFALLRVDGTRIRRTSSATSSDVRKYSGEWVMDGRANLNIVFE